MSNEEQYLWNLAYSTLRPKGTETPNQCLNRLTQEFFEGLELISQASATIERTHLSTADLVQLERHHSRAHNFDDCRPLVLVRIDERLVVVDGNHRVTRWLQSPLTDRHEAIIISPGI